jgi:hypothetical protein
MSRVVVGGKRKNVNAFDGSNFRNNFFGIERDLRRGYLLL